MIGNALDNSITGNAGGSEYLYGGEGNDTLTAVGNWDVLDGGAGDDVLQISNPGGTQNTTYIGGAGNDTITGSLYADTYVFNRGDGADVITDSGPHDSGGTYGDRLNFGADISASDIGARRVGVDLVITVAGQPG